MSYARRVEAQLARLGRDALVYEHATGATDEFNNPTDDYSLRADNPVTAVRTYPDRNQEIKGVGGDLQDDSPLFMVPQPRTADDPAPPGPEDRIEYDGVMYAIQGLTEYDTHVEFRASKVTEN